MIRKVSCYVCTICGVALALVCLAFHPVLWDATAMPDLITLPNPWNSGSLYLAVSGGTIGVDYDATCRGLAPPFLHRHKAIHAPIWPLVTLLIFYPWALVACGRLAKRSIALGALRWLGLLVTLFALGLSLYKIVFRDPSVHIQLPCGWLSMSLLAGAPTLWLWAGGRTPHQAQCVHCGYDLTGNTSGVCPECGTPTQHTEEGA